MRTKSEATRQAIIDSAATVFEEVGFDRASVADICERIGCSKATLYNYFTSKDELLIEVVLTTARAEHEATHHALEVENGDLRESLENFGKCFLEFLYSSRVRSARRLIGSPAVPAELNHTCYELGPQRTDKAVGQFLERGVKQGKLCPLEPRLAAQQLRALLEAEWTEKVTFGVVDKVTPAQIRRSAARAVATFLAAYRPS